MFQASFHGISVLSSPIAEALEREFVDGNAVTFDPALEDDAARISYVRALLRLRRDRGKMFGGGLFSDPAWDILLALYLSKLQQARVKVSSIIEESGVPPTTGLRWLTILIERGVVEKSCNPTDARSTLIELSDQAGLAMAKHMFDCRQTTMGAAQ